MIKSCDVGCKWFGVNKEIQVKGLKNGKWKA